MRLPAFRQTEIFKFLSSLKLAVLCLLSLSAILAVATVLESMYGMRGAYVLVYGTYWFYGVLALLATNVTCAALSRYPWKKHQTGFVITHLGIIVILSGSLVTQQTGVDGNLPIVEGSSDSRVILNEFRLVIFDETRGTQQAFPVTETAVRAVGDLMKLQFGGKELVVKEFLPRVRPIRRLKPSPIPGMGVPGIELELASSRFGEIDQTLLSTKPDGWTEVNLGPAKIAFRQFSSATEEKRFVSGAADALPAAAPAKQVRGEVVLNYKGTEYRVPIRGATKSWSRVGSTSLEMLVERYLPYAIVKDNQLISKSEQPINPAIQVRLRNPLGTEEKHTIFANFPEFDTLHGRSKIPEGERLGAKLRFIASAPDSQMAFVGGGRGMLAFGQSFDGKRLYYRSVGANKEIKASGEVKIGESTPIGWMDTEMRVTRWYPAAVQTTDPVYVESVAGTNGNFMAALRLESSTKDLDLAGEEWMMEGETRSLIADGKRYLLRFDRETLQLPFAIQLKKFTIGNDPGTQKAATYQSEVEVRDPASKSPGSPPPEAVISMNEPLKYGGYTFYQASYQLRDGEAPISVFSVNLDQGRWIKYLGSILLCLGICTMFYMNPHYWNVLLGGKKKE